MKFANSLVVLSCALLEVMAYPYYPSYGNVDSVSYGSIDNTRGGLALSRYYNPYYNPRVGGAGMAAFMFRQPEEQVPQSGQYYLPDRRRQTNLDYVPPQQNEVFYPQQPEQQQPEAPVAFPTEATELAEPTEKTELISTTLKAIVPELVEPEQEEEEVEEPTPKPKKAVASKKKQVKRPIDDDDDEEYDPKVPAAAFFPMFFGYGRRSGSGSPGPVAVANAYSTGRGGVATSHATAYGAPRPDSQYTDYRYKKN